jgi:hypothetical protein
MEWLGVWPAHAPDARSWVHFSYWLAGGALRCQKISLGVSALPRAAKKNMAIIAPSVVDMSASFCRA